MALGATPGGLLRLLLAEGMLPVAVGISFGLTVAVACDRVLTSQLYGLQATDPWSLLLAIDQQVAEARLITGELRRSWLDEVCNLVSRCPRSFPIV